MTFTLDTSGAVALRHTNKVGQTFCSTFWSDLDPFTQGYVEALLNGWIKASEFSDEGSDTCGFHAFRDLAPETLARIMADCARFAESACMVGLLNNAAQGHHFWSERQNRPTSTWPRLTPYLGDDGRVYLRDTASLPTSER